MRKQGTVTAAPAAPSGWAEPSGVTGTWRGLSWIPARAGSRQELDPCKSWFVYSAFSAGFIVGGTGLSVICASPRHSFCHSPGGKWHQGEIQPPNSKSELSLLNLIIYHNYVKDSIHTVEPFPFQRTNK